MYRDHARLWLTARILEETGSIDSPSGLRRLMEAVYGEEVDSELPDGPTGQLLGKRKELLAQSGASPGTNLLNFARGYVRDGGTWSVDAHTPTRLNDDMPVTLRLARIRADRIQPYAQEAAPNELWRAWRLSEVSISGRRVGAEALPPAMTQAAIYAKAEWSSFDKDKLLVVLGRIHPRRPVPWGSGDVSGRRAERGSVKLRPLCWLESRLIDSIVSLVPAESRRDEPGVEWRCPIVPTPRRG